MLGSAVRLPYHHPEKKDLSVFLARTELKQQKFVGSSRLSWKQFVPPGSCLSQVDTSSLDGARVSSEKVSSVVAAAESSSAVTNAVPSTSDVQPCVSESDVLPDLMLSCAKSETGPCDILLPSTESTVTQDRLASKHSERKLLLLSPIKKRPATSLPPALSRNGIPERLENSVESIETSLTPAVVKKLSLDPVDRKKPNLMTFDVTETVSLDVGEDADVESEMSDMAVDLKDGDDAIARQPEPSASATSSSRALHRVLPADVPLPQLSGNPNDFIELDDDDDDDDGENRPMNANDSGVERLKERLIQHAAGVAHTRKPKTIEIR